MSYTYGGDPSASVLDALRLLINDTDVSGVADSSRLADGELLYFYSVYDSNMYYAAAAAEQISARYAARVAYSADGVSVSFGDLQQKFADLADRLRLQARFLGRF